ncbi:b(0,+)-type amino acid transporter 1-like [Liolophura sinensis]|uniref:b(0,+)-type amino acid transporter 1-like n=1 Tax=Liolophura sinensis TaxID=3198878 RepID=UPI0031587747
MTDSSETKAVKRRSGSPEETEKLNPEDGATVEVKGALKKNVGLVSAVALIVGTMIGSGVFISPTGVLKYSGSVGASLIVWAGCGILALLGALTYAELGTCVPLSGGEHAYYMFTYKNMGRNFGQLPAFLYAWVGIFIIRPVMFSVISLSLGTYIVKPFFPDCEPPIMPIKLITAAAMLIITFVNCYSVKIATQVQNVFTAAKLLAVVIISIGGIYFIAAGNTETISEGFEDTAEDPSLIALAFYNGLWAYDGWNNLNFITEELKDPYKNLPRAIIIGIPLTACCYVLANIGYFGVMSRVEILASPAVAVQWGERVLGVMAWLMPMFVVMSCFGASNGCLFASGRLCYVAGRDGHLPKVVSYIHTTKVTPAPALIFTLITGIIFLIPGDISTLIDFYGFITWIVYGFSALTLLVLRFGRKDLQRPYKVNIAHSHHRPHHLVLSGHSPGYQRT